MNIIDSIRTISQRLSKMKPSCRRKYKEKGNCSQCFFGPVKQSIKPFFCRWDEIEIDKLSTEHNCNHFYRSDFCRK